MTAYPCLNGQTASYKMPLITLGRLAGVDDACVDLMQTRQTK